MAIKAWTTGPKIHSLEGIQQVKSLWGTLPPLKKSPESRTGNRKSVFHAHFLNLIIITVLKIFYKSDQYCIVSLIISWINAVKVKRSHFYSLEKVKNRGKRVNLSKKWADLYQKGPNPRPPSKSSWGRPESKSSATDRVKLPENLEIFWNIISKILYPKLGRTILCLPDELPDGLAHIWGTLSTAHSSVKLHQLLSSDPCSGVGGVGILQSLQRIF